MWVDFVEIGSILDLKFWCCLVNCKHICEINDVERCWYLMIGCSRSWKSSISLIMLHNDNHKTLISCSSFAVFPSSSSSYQKVLTLIATIMNFVSEVEMAKREKLIHHVKSLSSQERCLVELSYIDQISIRPGRQFLLLFTPLFIHSPFHLAEVIEYLLLLQLKWKRLHKEFIGFFLQVFLVLLLLATYTYKSKSFSSSVIEFKSSLSLN